MTTTVQQVMDEMHARFGLDGMIDDRMPEPIKRYSTPLGTYYFHRNRGYTWTMVNF